MFLQIVTTTGAQGANLKESKLTAQNVNAQSFGKLFEREVDGDAFAQPLIKTGVAIQARGSRSVAFCSHHQ